MLRMPYSILLASWSQFSKNIIFMGISFVLLGSLFRWRLDLFVSCAYVTHFLSFFSTALKKFSRKMLEKKMFSFRRSCSSHDLLKFMFNSSINSSFTDETPWCLLLRHSLDFSARKICFVTFSMLFFPILQRLIAIRWNP